KLTIRMDRAGPEAPRLPPLNTLKLSHDTGEPRMSFLDRTISFQVFHPNLGVPISRRADAVVGDGVEFEDIELLELPAGNVANADIDVGANRISYVIDAAS